MKKNEITRPEKDLEKIMRILIILLLFGTQFICMSDSLCINSSFKEKLILKKIEERVTNIDIRIVITDSIIVIATNYGFLPKIKYLEENGEFYIVDSSLTKIKVIDNIYNQYTELKKRYSNCKDIDRIIIAIPPFNQKVLKLNKNILDNMKKDNIKIKNVGFCPEEYSQEELDALFADYAVEK